MEIINSNFTPEYFDLVGNSTNEWEIEIGLASISNNSVLDQVKGISGAFNR